jgi:hypothetical protein
MLAFLTAVADRCQDAAHKQLSTVVLAEPEAVEVLSKSTTTAPAPRAAAAAESTPVTPPVTADDADMFGVQGAAASSSSSGADAAAAPEAEPDSGAAPGGLWTGIKSAIAEAASAVTHSSSAAGDEGAQETGDSAGVQGDMHIGELLVRCNSGLGAEQAGSGNAQPDTHGPATPNVLAALCTHRPCAAVWCCTPARAWKRCVGQGGDASRRCSCRVACRQ